jgi:hypothetical protein
VRSRDFKRRRHNEEFLQKLKQQPIRAIFATESSRIRFHTESYRLWESTSAHSKSLRVLFGQRGD